MEPEQLRLSRANRNRRIYRMSWSYFCLKVDEIMMMTPIFPDRVPREAWCNPQSGSPQFWHDGDILSSRCTIDCRSIGSPVVSLRTGSDRGNPRREAAIQPQTQERFRLRSAGDGAWPIVGICPRTRWKSTSIPIRRLRV